MYPSSLAFKEDFTSKATPLVPPMAQLSVKSVEPCPPWANKKEEMGVKRLGGKWAKPIKVRRYHHVVRARESQLKPGR